MYSQNTFKLSIGYKCRMDHNCSIIELFILRKEKTRYYITPPVLDIALERYLEYNGKEQILKAITGVR